MSRLKTFLKYLILFILFYLFVSFMSYGLLKSTLQPMENNSIDIDENGPQVLISEAKSSKVSGYVKGTINNTTGNEINNKYLRIDLISNRENVILTKYVELNNFKNKEEKDFDVRFNAENIKRCKISISDTGREFKDKANKQELGLVICTLLFGWIKLF